MKLPRDLSGADLAKALAKLGYEITRQTGSHLRLTTEKHGEHHVSVPEARGPSARDAPFDLDRCRKALRTEPRRSCQPPVRLTCCTPVRVHCRNLLLNGVLFPQSKVVNVPNGIIFDPDPPIRLAF